MRGILIILLLLLSVTASSQDLLHQAIISRDNGDYEQELSLLEQYLNRELKPYQRIAALTEKVLAYDCIAKKAKNTGDFEKAKSTYSNALSDQSLSQVHKCDIAVNAAELYLRLLMPDSAMDLLEAYKPEEERQLKAWLMAKASVHHYRGEPQEAIDLYDKIESEYNLSDQERVSLLSNRAYAKITLGDISDATINDLKLAYSQSGNPVILSNAAVAESMAGYHESALKDINTVLKTIPSSSPDYSPALRKKAEILRKKGDFSESGKIWKSFFLREKELITKVYNDPTESEQRKLDLWYTHRALLSEAFALKDNAPELLYDIALFRGAISMSGRNGPGRIYTSSDIKKIIPKGTVTVEFIRYHDNGTENYAALILTSKDGVKFVYISESETINEYEIDDYTLRDILKMTTPSFMDEVYRDTGLAELLWRPILENLPANTDRIVFSPDGILNLIAIENLCPDSRLKLLRTTSTALVAIPCKKIPASPKALVAGGINYDKVDRNDHSEPDHRAYETLVRKRPGLFFPFCNGTSIEADSVGTILNGETKDTLSEASFKKSAGEYDIIHLATHGYSFDIDISPAPIMHRDSITADNTLLSSGITLLGANVAGIVGVPQDGLLSAREICEMDLSGVSLVILSACSTGLGVADEGPAGLIRALKKAGVGAIIATLWPVDDFATIQFMTSLYDCDLSSLPDAMTFARKQLKTPSGTQRYFDKRKKRYITGQTESYDSPRFWAPFILIDAL